MRPASAGVEVREGAKVELGDGNTVTIGCDRFTADAIVGADGANGMTAKAVGLGSGIVYGVAYEGNVSYPPFRSERYARRSCSSWRTFPAATAGSSRKATTRTSASAAGRAKARRCASISPRL